MAGKTWNPVWDAVFSSRSWGGYPNEDMIRFVARRFGQRGNHGAIRMLDVGSGPGSTSWYLAREGYDVTAVDGSSQGIERLNERMRAEGLFVRTAISDLASLPFPDGWFDCAVEVHSLMCNGAAESSLIVAEIHRVLKPGGLFFSRTPSTQGWAGLEGTPSGRNTYSECTAGPFAGMGTVRLMDRDQIEDLYAPLNVISVDHVAYTEFNGVEERTYWLVQAAKQEGAE